MSGSQTIIIPGPANALLVSAGQQRDPITNAATDGQLYIGKADGTMALATLTQGSNVTITNGDGTITIAASGGSAFTLAQTLAAGNTSGANDATFEQAVNFGGSSGNSYMDSSGDLRGRNSYTLFDHFGNPCLVVNGGASAPNSFAVSGGLNVGPPGIQGQYNGPLFFHVDQNSAPVVIGDTSTPYTGSVADIPLITLIGRPTNDTSTPLQIAANGGVSLRTDGAGHFGGPVFAAENLSYLGYTDTNNYLGGTTYFRLANAGYTGASLNGGSGALALSPIASAVPLSVNAASGQSALLAQFTSFGGSAGDIFSIGPTGNLSAAGTVTAGKLVGGTALWDSSTAFIGSASLDQSVYTNNSIWVTSSGGLHIQVPSGQTGNLEVAGAQIAAWNASAFYVNVPLVMAAAIQLSSYAVASLPVGAAGEIVFASDGCNPGEGTGTGTGTTVQYNSGVSAWCIMGTNTPVTA